MRRRVWILFGALASGSGYLLYNRALRDLEATQVGTFVNLVPVVGVASGVAILGRPSRSRFS